MDVHFTYDAFDRRIGKLSGGVQQWTVYDGLNPYADFNGSTMTTRYLYGNGVDDILARTDAAGNNTAWYLKDQLGSVRLIVSAAGAVLYSVNYDSFGNILSQSGSGGDRFKFTGREWDAEIGLYYYRARYFDPGTGRFLSEDPLQFGAGDVNLYRYVGNGPNKDTDPLGLDPRDRAILGPLYNNLDKVADKLISRLQFWLGLLEANKNNPIAFKILQDLFDKTDKQLDIVLKLMDLLIDLDKLLTKCGL